MTFDQVFSLYLEAHHKLTQASRSVIAMGWRQFREFVAQQGLVEFAELEGRHVDGFQQHLTWEPNQSGKLYSSNTVDSILRHVRGILRWATAEGLLMSDPSLHLSLHRPLQPTSPILGWPELQAILAACDTCTPHGLRDAALFAMLTETKLGLRRCLALNMADLPGLVLEESTTARLRSYLDAVRPRWMRVSGQRAVFLTAQGGRLGPCGVAVRLDELAKIAGVEGSVTPRMLWRSYQVALAQHGHSRLVFPLAEPLN